MKKHRYRITIAPIAGPDCATTPDSPILQFEASNHDDILALVERSRQRGHFETETAAAFTVGLKLFSEVMLENRNHPLFADFLPHFGQFMKGLKAG